MQIFTYPIYATFVPLCSALLHAKISGMKIKSFSEEAREKSNQEEIY